MRVLNTTERKNICLALCVHRMPNVLASIRIITTTQQALSSPRISFQLNDKKAIVYRCFYSFKTTISFQATLLDFKEDKKFV